MVESDMSSEAMEGSAEGERLSALVDGELDSSATEAACRLWKNDVQARCSWHAYHLIGDVLRSDDLAVEAGRDERFLLSLRARLDAEPVVLAPAPLPASIAVRSRVAGSAANASRWMLPSAVAAALLLVAGTFTVLRSDNLAPATAPTVALADAAAQVATSSVDSVEPVAMVMNGKLVRDARLDRYLAAHKQFSGSSALGLPSAFLRAATVETDGR
jgi:sigma-E factor negative regulatory protein RseA